MSGMWKKARLVNNMNDHFHYQKPNRTGKKFGSQMYAVPIQKNVFVVTGAPGSGKSYLVNKEATVYDIVFDYDKIAEAMNPAAGMHGNHTYMMSVLLAIRETVIRCFAARTGDWHNAYFITASPDRQLIEELIRKMRAIERHVDATMEECIERIKNDNTRSLKARDIDLVRDYFLKQQITKKDNPWNK